MKQVKRLICGLIVIAMCVTLGSSMKFSAKAAEGDVEIKGAQILKFPSRDGDGKQALQLAVTINYEGATDFGMYVVKKSNLANPNNYTVADVKNNTKAEKLSFFDAEKDTAHLLEVDSENKILVYGVALMNVPVANYGSDVVAVGYVEKDDVTTDTLFARSVTEVAVKDGSFMINNDGLYVAVPNLSVLTWNIDEGGALKTPSDVFAEANGDGYKISFSPTNSGGFRPEIIGLPDDYYPQDFSSIVFDTTSVAAQQDPETKVFADDGNTSYAFMPLDKDGNDLRTAGSFFRSGVNTVTSENLNSITNSPMKYFKISNQTACASGETTRSFVINSITFSPVNIPKFKYQVPAAQNENEFYLDLEKCTTKASFASPAAPIAHIYNDYVEYDYTGASDQTLVLTLSDEQKALLANSSAMYITINATAAKAMSLRVIMCNPTSNSNWNGTGASDLTFSNTTNISTVNKQLTFANNANTSNPNVLTALMMQQRGSSVATSVTINSIKISYVPK